MVLFGRFSIRCQTGPSFFLNTGRSVNTPHHIFLAMFWWSKRVKLAKLFCFSFYLLIYFPKQKQKAYVEVNQFFADKTMEAVDRLLQQDKDVLPLVWVHDYHLTLAASIIRKVPYLFLPFIFSRFTSRLLILAPIRFQSFLFGMFPYSKQPKEVSESN